MEKPHPERGWEILDEIAATLPEERQAEFIWEARIAEGSFTSGYITEDSYRTLLTVLRDGCEEPLMSLDDHAGGRTHEAPKRLSWKE